MSYYCIIGRLKFIITCAFHFPCIFKHIISDNSFSGFIIVVIDPFWITSIIKKHFLERMQITGNGVLICIPSIIQTIKIMFLSHFHHVQLCLHLYFCNWFNSYRDLFRCSHTFTGEGNNQVSYNIIVAGKTIYRYSVSIDSQCIIVSCNCNFFIFKNLFSFNVFDFGVSWKLYVTCAGRSIKFVTCGEIFQLICCIILIQNRFQFFFCRLYSSGSFNCYLEFLCQSYKVRYFF